MSDWVLLLAILGGLVLLGAVLVTMAAIRTHGVRDSFGAEGIRTKGVKAFASFMTPLTEDGVRDRIDTVVESHRRFSRTEDVDGGLNVYVRANIWTWGEVIEVRFADANQGTQVTATCRPRLQTTLIDYGQSGKDLGLFMSLLKRRTESGLRGNIP